MLSEDKYFRDLTEAELWQRYCGFLDLSIDEFMDIQEELLMDQIDRVADSILGKKIMGNPKPESVEEFRRMVPITTYDDYEPYLSEQRDDALAEKSVFWCHSSGRGGKFKWIPYTPQMLDRTIHHLIGVLILASAPHKGHVALKPGQRVLLNTAPRPYSSGSVFYHLTQRFSLCVMPPQEEEEKMDFQERIAQGFKMAMKNGIDEISSIASILVKVGERMGQQAQGMKFSLSMLHPAILLRVSRAYLRSKLARRPMLPKDLWTLKALIAAGTDAKIYKEQLVHYWGRLPYEIYGATEAMPIAINGLNKKWLTLVPDVAFWEFMPHRQLTRFEKDEKYQPATVLAHELKPGETYEIVLTQFYGMPLLRYRIADLITVVDDKDEEARINLPQIAFKARASDLIDLAGLAELYEKTIWEAIANSGIECEEWCARKEYDQNQTYLRLYLELKKDMEPAKVAHTVDQQLRTIDMDYRDIGDQLSLEPVKVTLLSTGTFQRYYEAKQREGVDLAHLKPPHMNAHDSIIEQLLRLSDEGKGV